MDLDDWRQANACIRCHSLKLKCRRSPGEADCTRCIKHQLLCKPRPPKRQSCSNRHDSPESLQRSPQPMLSSHSDMNQAASSTTHISPVISTNPVVDFLVQNPDNPSSDLLSFGPYGFDYFSDSQREPATPLKHALHMNYFDTPTGDQVAAEPYRMRQAHESQLQEWATEWTSNDDSAFDDGNSQEKVFHVPETSSPTDLWLQNLLRVNMDLFAWRDLPTLPVLCEPGNASIIDSNNQAQTLFLLAARLLMLVEELGILVPASDISRHRDNTIDKSSNFAALDPTKLLDQSNSLLLSSSYTKLLDIFDRQVRRIETSGPSTSNSLRSSSARGILLSSATQDFVTVNMVAFYTRRIGKVLEPLVREDPSFCSHGTTNRGQCLRTLQCETMIPQPGNRSTFVHTRDSRTLPFEIMVKQSALLEEVDATQARLLGLA